MHGHAGQVDIWTGCRGVPARTVVNRGQGTGKGYNDAWDVFGRGSYVCIGKDLALMLNTLVVAKVSSTTSASCSVIHFHVLANGIYRASCKGIKLIFIMLPMFS